jgi:ankyrin repeat protein
MLLGRKDVEVNAKSNCGKTALMWTSYHKEYDLELTVRLMLDRKDIDVDAKDNDGNTALMHAIHKKRDKIANEIRPFVLFFFVSLV